MLAVSSSPFRRNEREGEIDSTFPMGGFGDEFPDFCGDNLLDSIDFDELFVGIKIDGDVLPDLEMDGGDFSVSGGEDSSEMNTFTSASFEKTEEDKVSGSGSGSSLIQEEEIVSKGENESVAVVTNSSRKDGHEKRKKSKNHQGKRKVKVDWTPELHKRFVQAVEQLGVDKAVPSRILELMGIDCLTRHNIASHLQKYRSHRKHLIARETEAASWSHRRQMYGGGGGGGGMKREIMSNSSSWLGVAPTMGFPPMAPPPIMPHHFRPLHVWGHPHVDRSLGRVWPKHIAPSPAPPPPPFAHHPPPPPPPLDSSFWHAQHQRIANSFTPGTPYFPPPPQLPPTRFPTPPVQGIPPHSMYKVDAGSGAPLTNAPAGPPLVDFHPSKESIDAAIGDVLTEPWQPLPIGLKPPSLDSVMVELNHQGIEKIPPTCTLAT